MERPNYLTQFNFWFFNNIPGSLTWNLLNKFKFSHFLSEHEQLTSDCSEQPKAPGGSRGEEWRGGGAEDGLGAEAEEEGGWEQGEAEAETQGEGAEGGTPAVCHHY